jgi:Ca2+-binding EF-hand superfamily protein
VFATFDKDNSGTVEKPEMVVFIKQLLGGNWEFRLIDERITLS